MTVQPLEAHPLPLGAARLHGVLDSMPLGAWAGLDASTTRTTMTDLARAKARIEAQMLAGARSLESSGAARKAGATSTGDLLSKDFGGDRAGGDRLVKTAKALSQASRTEAELQAGHVSLEQARVIADGMTKLPETATPQQRDLCERGLLSSARKLNLKDLRRRTDRAIDAYKDRQKTDEFENDQLQHRERRARANSTFSMWDKRDGTWEGRFRLPEAQAEMLKTAVEAIAAPRRTHLRAVDEAASTTNPAPFIRDELDTEHRLGQGFLELCSHLPTDKLPTAGGVGALLTVNLDLDTLIEGIRPATLSTGTRISAGQARLMACHLGILPQVFNGKPLPLDHGTTKRLFPPRAGPREVPPPRPNGSRWRNETAAARFLVATGPRDGVKRTTTRRTGPTAAPPTSKTAPSSAPCTTTSSTTTTGTAEPTPTTATSNTGHPAEPGNAIPHGQARGRCPHPLPALSPTHRPHRRRVTPALSRRRSAAPY